MECKICGATEVPDFRRHLRDSHHMGPWEYLGVEWSGRDLSVWDPGVGIAWRPGMVLDGIPGAVRSDPWLRALLVSESALENVLDRNLQGAASIVKSVSGPAEDTDILIVGTKPGFPPEISERNRAGIRVTKVPVPGIERVPGAWIQFEVPVTRTPVRVLFPEVTSYDLRHHARYSILNPNLTKSSRNTKRIRISGTDTCYRFWNNRDWPWTKSIFRVVDPMDPETEIGELTGITGAIVKAMILRDPEASDVFWSIWGEVRKGVPWFDDHVVLRSEVRSMGQHPAPAKFTWTPGPIGRSGRTICISVL